MRESAAGFTLIEVVIALTLIAVTVIALAPLFVYASKETGAAGEMGTAGALAVQRMEMLRAIPFTQLANGGSLSTSVHGYHDATDPTCVVRWTIADKPGTPTATKIVTVRATVTWTGKRVRRAELVTVRSN